jgi:beta-phosphoglucomutase-like phosphatase (HAD superfamily)
MSRFKAVIFDLDGVITDTAHYHYLAWKQLAESQGVHFDHEFNESLKGIDRMGSLDLILASAARQYTPEEKLALADTKNRHYQELISTMSADDLLPGAVAALDAVRAPACASAWPRSARTPLQCWVAWASPINSITWWMLPPSRAASRIRKSSCAPPAGGRGAGRLPGVEDAVAAWRPSRPQACSHWG